MRFYFLGTAGPVDLIDKAPRAHTDSLILTHSFANFSNSLSYGKKKISRPPESGFRRPAFTILPGNTKPT